MSGKPEKRILIIEDEKHIAEGLRLNLSMTGYMVRVAGDGVDGLAQWQAWHPDLIILDIMLPGIDGFAVLQRIRLEDERLPILILSARTAPDDRIKGLTHGVDDYLVKPFNLEELQLRVQRLLTRAAWGRGETSGAEPVAAGGLASFAFGGNRIDFAMAQAEGPGGRVSLTDQEMRLLKLFISNRGQVLSRQRLLEIGWGYSGRMTTRTVDNFIVRFRKYFEDDPKHPRYFKSIRSVGYLFDDGGKADSEEV